MSYSFLTLLFVDVDHNVFDACPAAKPWPVGNCCDFANAQETYCHAAM